MLSTDFVDVIQGDYFDCKGRAHDQKLTIISQKGRHYLFLTHKLKEQFVQLNMQNPISSSQSGMINCPPQRQS